MRILRTMILIPALALAACRHDQPQQAADTAGLNTDLQLAGQQQRAMDSVSALERTGATTAAAPARTGSSSATHTTRTARRSSSHTYSSGGSVSSAGSASPPSSGHTEVVKHTRRDAAIGAAAGAAIGAASSHSVKGGVIGAVVGGVAGAVIGNNVDKKKKRVP